MNERIKNVYRTYLLEYIKRTYPDIRPNEKKLLQCPKCHTQETAQLHHNKITCYEPNCNSNLDIFDYIRCTKTSMPDVDDETIAEYLNHVLKIELSDDSDELLQYYAQAGFCLIPIVQGNSNSQLNKRPPSGFKWRDQVYKNPKIWRDWLDRGWGLGLVLGQASGVDAIDIDSITTLEKVKHLLGETLIQDTSKGYHYIYNYDPDITKTLNKVLRNDGYEMEYRTTGAYIVIAPSTTAGEVRKWNHKKIIAMPKELKEFLLPYYSKGVQEQTVEEEIQDAITNNDLTSTKLNGLNGCCNDTFVKLGGIFRKKMNQEQVVYALSHFNNLLENPIDKKSFYSLCAQIEKYNHYDKEELAKIVMDRLDVIKEGTAFQIASSLRYETKDVEDVLKYLEDQSKVYNIGNRKYQVINHIEWTTETNDLSVPVDFEVPYFHKVARFDKGNMIIIGGTSGAGKTHLTGNIIKKLVDQGIKPYLINTEAGSKIGKITEQLGVPPHSYYLPKKIVKHPTDIELMDDVVTLIDWLKPKDGDYAKTDNTFEYLHNQLKKHSGLLIVMTQLRNSNNEFFASDQIQFYGALVAKYLYGDNGKDPENTYFKTVKIRDSRTGMQYLDLPMFFHRDSKILEPR